MDLKTSTEYHNPRFGLDGYWETASGRQESRYLTQLTIDLMPGWLRLALRNDGLSLCDWGCGLGDGTTALSKEFGVLCTGVNFSETKVAKARSLNTAPEFLLVDRNNPSGVSWDVTITSSTISHHPDPWTELEVLAGVTNGALVALIPYKEFSRSGDHQYAFLRRNIPARIGLLQIIHAKSIDISNEFAQRQMKRQMLLVYGAPDFITRYQLSLDDICFDDLDLQEKFADLTVGSDNLLAEKADLIEKSVEADAYRRASENQVRELLASRSWKISAPFRAAAIAARKAGEVLRHIRTRRAPNQELMQSHLPDPAPDLESFFKVYDKILIVYSALPFDPDASFETSIAIAKAAAAAGYGVIFIGWHHLESDELERPNSVVWPGIFEIGRFDLYQLVDLLKKFDSVSSTLLVTIPSAEIVRSLVALEAAKVRVIYHVVDDWEYIKELGLAPWFDATLEKHLVLNAAKVTVVTPGLQALFVRDRDAQVVGNGHQTPGLFRTLADIPSNQSSKVGYFGPLLEELFDWDLVFALALACPELSLEMVGYGHSASTAEQARMYPNLKVLEYRSIHQVPDIASEWTVGLLPFRANRRSAALDPPASYEYLNLGLPIVSTGLPHLLHYPNTHSVEGEHAFVSAVQRLVHQPLNLAPAEPFLQAATWASRLKQIMQ